MKLWLKFNIKRIIYKILNIQYDIGKNSIPILTTFEGKNKIGNNVILYNNKLGFGTYVGNWCVFNNTIIGKYCSIASNVKIIEGAHPKNTFVSTHPAFFSILKQAGFTYTDKQKFKEFKYIDEKEKISVIIGNDVWIGQDVRILSGVKIGDGAIIGAGSLITKDIEPYGIYVGIPAKKIKDRFNKEEKDFLISYKWWNKSESWIKDNVDIFSDIRVFMKKINNKIEGEK